MKNCMLGSSIYRKKKESEVHSECILFCFAQLMVVLLLILHSIATMPSYYKEKRLFLVIVIYFFSIFKLLGFELNTYLYVILVI
jgi:hypothetical protein